MLIKKVLVNVEVEIIVMKISILSVNIELEILIHYFTVYYKLTKWINT